MHDCYFHLTLHLLNLKHIIIIHYADRHNGNARRNS